MHTSPEQKNLESPQVASGLESAKGPVPGAENPQRKERFYILFEKIRVSQSEVDAHYRLFKHLQHNDSLGFLYVYYDCHEKMGRFSANHDTARFLIEQGIGSANKTGHFELNEKARALGRVMLRGKTMVDRELVWPEAFGKIPD